MVLSCKASHVCTLSIAVRYQNACHNIKIRCNNSSVLALAFPLLLRFSIRLAFLGLTLRLALSFRWRAAALPGPFPRLAFIKNKKVTA